MSRLTRISTLLAGACVLSLGIAGGVDASAAKYVEATSRQVVYEG